MASTHILPLALSAPRRGRGGGRPGGTRRTDRNLTSSGEIAGWGQLPEVRRTADPGRRAGRRPRADRPIPPRPVFIAMVLRPARVPRGMGRSAGSSWRRWRRGRCSELLGKKIWDGQNPGVETGWSTANWRCASTAAVTRRARTGRRSWRWPTVTSRSRMSLRRMERAFRGQPRRPLRRGAAGSPSRACHRRLSATP